MGQIPKGFYEKKLKSFNVSKTDRGYKLSLDFTPQGKALDIAQDALDAAVLNDMVKYMPVDTGSLVSETIAVNQSVRGLVYAYPPSSEYGHYQYEGVLYVDPVYGKGAFFSPEYGFWSRPGVSKVPSDRRLTYSQPNATAEWAKTAIDNHKDEWIEVVRRASS